MAGRSPSPLSSSAAAPALIPLGHHSGKPAIPLVRPVTVIGSRSNARVHLTSSTVSKAHALVVRDGNTTYIRDLNSRTQVFINGDKVRERDLNDGDLIKIGSFTFKFRAASVAASEDFDPVAPAQLQVSDAEYPVPIDQRVMLIGRRPGSDIHLLEPSVSTAHAVILEMNGQRHIRDLGSRTGTYINGVAVHQYPINAGDSIKIGETTLTYVPGAARLPGEASGEADQIFEDELSSGSATGLSVADDSLAPATDELQTDSLELSKPAPRHIEAQPQHDADELEDGELEDGELEDGELEPAAEGLSKSASDSEALTAAGSIDNALDELPLSDEAEKLSTEEAASDSEPRTEGAADAVAESDADISAHSLEETLPRRGWRTAPQPEIDSESLALDAGESASGEADASADVDSQDESVLRFEKDQTAEETPIEPNLNLGADDSSTAVLDLEPETPDHDQADRPILNVDISKPTAPKFESKPAAELDLSALSREAESSDDASLEFSESTSDGSTPSEPAAPIAPSMRFDQDSTDKPLIDADVVPPAPIELPPVKPEKVAASRTRRKPKQSVADQSPENPSTEITKSRRGKKQAPQPEVIAEVVEATEPTPESALDLDAATAEIAAEEKKADSIEAIESLTDTALSRAMNDLGSEAGDIIESPEPEAAPAIESRSEYSWGANQENFLGSPPVDLPSAQQTGEAIQEVNALIDEILAPGSPDSTSADAIVAESAEPNEAERAGLDLSPNPPEEGESNRAAARAIPPLQMPPVAAPPMVPLTPSQSRPVVPIPPPPARGPRRRRRESQTLEPVGSASVAGKSNGVRDDERIPPYAGAAPATAGRVTTSFDGLAMPPVRETDVFFQMSPPAAEDDRFTGAPGVAPLTPMDLVQPDEAASQKTTRTRRPAVSGRASVPRDLFFGGPPAGGNGGTNGGSLSGGSFGSTNGGKAAVADAPIEFAPAPAPAPAAEVESPARRRTTVRPAVPGLTVPAPEISIPDSTFAPPTVEPDEEIESLADIRRRRTRRLAMIAIAGAVVWIGLSAAIFSLFPPKVMTEAPVRFANYDSLKESERRQLQNEEAALLSKEATRREARRLLAIRDSEVSPGFLDDAEGYLAAASLTRWQESKTGVMVLRHLGRDDGGDKVRMLVMAQALITANKSRIDSATTAKNQYDELRANHTRDQQDQQRLTGEIEKIRAQGDAAPDAAAIKAIQDDITALDKKWSDALLAVKAAEAELAQLKGSADAPAANDAGNGGAPTTAPAANDDKLAQMQDQLKDLTSKMTAAQSAKAEQAATAKKALDDSLGDFEKQVAATKELMKDSPELASYVAAAQELQDNTRSLIEDLIRREDQQYSRLNELKTTLTEKMEQKRAEQENADPQLKDLNGRLETARRQLNAAKSAGMKKEADDQQAQVDLLANMVRSRQDQLPQDGLKDYADTIAQLQTIIDVTQQNVESDRKRIEDTLAKMQKGLSTSATVEKLPEAQKAAAAELEKRLAEINTARASYNQAISATAVNEDDSTKQMRTQIAALQTDIDAHKKEIADAAVRNQSQQEQKTRDEQIAAKQSQLADLQRSETDARLARMNRDKDLRDAQTAQAAANENADRLQQLQDQKTKLDNQVAQEERDEKGYQEKAASAVQPLPITEDEVVVKPGSDNRPWYFAGTTVAVSALVGLAMFLTLHNGGRELVGNHAGAILGRSQTAIEEIETPASDESSDKSDSLDDTIPQNGSHEDDTPDEDAGEHPEAAL